MLIYYSSRGNLTQDSKNTHFLALDCVVLESAFLEVLFAKRLNNVSWLFWILKDVCSAR